MAARRVANANQPGLPRAKHFGPVTPALASSGTPTHIKLSLEPLACASRSSRSQLARRNLGLSLFARSRRPAPAAALAAIRLAFDTCRPTPDDQHPRKSQPALARQADGRPRHALEAAPSHEAGRSRGFQQRPNRRQQLSVSATGPMGATSMPWRDGRLASGDAATPGAAPRLLGARRM